MGMVHKVVDEVADMMAEKLGIYSYLLHLYQICIFCLVFSSSRFPLSVDSSNMTSLNVFNSSCQWMQRSWEPSFGWNGLRENSRKAARAGRGNLSKIEVKCSWNMFRGCSWSFPDQEWETLQAAPNAKLHLGTAVAKYWVAVAVVAAKVILVC